MAENSFCEVSLDGDRFLRAEPGQYERLQGLLAARHQVIEIPLADGDVVSVPASDILSVGLSTAAGRARFHNLQTVLEAESGKPDKGESW